MDGVWHAVCKVARVTRAGSASCNSGLTSSEAPGKQTNSSSVGLHIVICMHHDSVLMNYDNSMK